MKQRITFIIVGIMILGAMPVPSGTIAQSASATWHWQAGQPDQITLHVTQPHTFQFRVAGLKRKPLVGKVTEQHALSAQPVTILRRGLWRGDMFVVLRINPRYNDPQGLWEVQTLDVAIESGVIVTELPNDQETAFGDAPPIYQRAERTGSIAHIDRAGGMKAITAQSLSAAGWTLPISSESLHIERNGVELLGDVHDGGDGTLEAGDQVVVYVPPTIDRWNTTQILWISIDGATTAPHMQTRTMASGTAPLRSTAYQVLHWSNPSTYHSSAPSVDGDQWWSTRLTSGAGYQPASIEIPFTPTLPLVSLTSIAVHGTTTGGTDHALEIEQQRNQWHGIGPYQQSWTMTATNPQLTLRVPSRPSIPLDDQLVETVVTTATVRLNDFQARGAAWTTLDGTWQYALGNLPFQRILYDVSQPNAPQRIWLPAGNQIVLQDDSVHSYILFDATTIPTVQLEPYRPTSLPTIGDQLVVAPSAWHGALEPLKQWRAAQGYTLAFVDPIDLYARWSFGLTDPEALRRFFQYTAATWSIPPSSVLLVGDGTLDPHGYSGYRNPQIIPPYLADVDLWIGETACDACFVQLDGDSPLDDELPDMTIGRLPVHTLTDVEALVNKLIGYDQQLWQPWMERVVSLSDNYRNAAGGVVTANDFPTIAARSETLYPEGTHFERVYYDPYSATASQLGHQFNAQRAFDQTQASLRSGAAVVQYVGHGSPWQWASTDTTIDQSYLTNVVQAETTTMGGQPVVLSLTCTTSSFHLPSQRGYGLDEAFILNPYGAIATWGSTGVGVAHGHEYLQQGFVRQLQHDDHQLGTATWSGMWTLWSEGQCCTDALRTFVIFGDPLTPLRLKFGYHVYLPLIQR